MNIFDSVDELASAAAARTAHILTEAIATRGFARLVLTGGTAGVATAAALAQRTELDWESIEVYFGDERYVAANSDERNAQQIFQVLLGDLLPRMLYVFPSPSGDAEDTIDADADTAQAFFSALEPLDSEGTLFDVHLLGMGNEGHINSLFPHTEELACSDRLVVAVRDCPKPPPFRLSLTTAAVNASRNVMFTVSGADKAEVVSTIAAGTADPSEIPAAAVAGREHTLWFVDKLAAAT